jgi:hypothetical protein
MSDRAPMPFGWYVLSVLLQCAHVLGATVSQDIGNLAGIWGVTIPLVIAFLWGRSGPGTMNAVKQGFILGFVPAFIGLVLAFSLGQVEAFLLAAGSASSGVTAILGALLGNALAGKG